MAQQAVRKQTNEDAPEPSRRGRPVGSRNQKAGVNDGAGKKKIFDYSKKVSFQKPTDFYLWLSRYPDKTGILAALYRLKPMIDHGLVGIDDAAIHRTTVESEMTEEWAGENYGRGEYMLIVTDANREGQREAARTFFNCRTSTKAPIYDPRTLCLGETKNQDEITRLIGAGVMVRDTATNQPRLRNESDGPTAAQSHSAPGAAGGGEIFGRDLVGQIVLAALNRSNQTPHDAVKDTIEVAKLMGSGAAPFDIEAVVERVVNRLGGKTAEDPFTVYERIDGMMKKARGPVNAATGLTEAVAGAVADGGGVAAWAPHLPSIFSEGRALLGELFSGLRLMKAEQAQQTRNGNGAPHPAAAAPVQRAALNPEQRIEEIFRLAVEQMTLGTKGYDFAGWVYFRYPDGAQILRSLEPLGVQGVVSSLAMHPQGRELVNNETVRVQLESFLADFFEFDPSPESASASVPAAAAAASAA